MKRGKTSIFIVNKRLREAIVKFLIEHDKKEFKYCIITLYIEETPDTNISDTLCWGSFHFPKPLINPDVLLDNAFKVEQKVKYKSDLQITGIFQDA